ncbi:MAG: Uma2 family endonuclease [Armatimonadetes bacterium]|nr:Uma2 family endonuclease [Anaerolineae bacterium]
METPINTRTEQIGMALGEYLARGDEKFEIINGKVMPSMPTLAYHNSLIHMIYSRLFMYFLLQQMVTGKARIEATIIQPARSNRNWVKGSYTPDVSVYLGTRLADYTAATPDWRERPFELIPDITIEVLSPTDQPQDIVKKIDAYLQLGVREVVIVDAKTRHATRYLPGAEPVATAADSPDAALTFDDLLPGFALPLTELFDISE